jgi:Icc-related predicted phosphoesterase
VFRISSRLLFCLGIGLADYGKMVYNLRVQKKAGCAGEQRLRAMKILTLSDKVIDFIYSPQLREKFGDVELVLSCGDLPFYYLEYIVSMLNVPLFYVMGNHDKKVEYSANGQARTAPQGCVNIDNRVIQHKGLLIGGLEGSMRYTGDPRFQYTDPEMHFKVLQMAPQLFSNRIFRGKYLDILITHAPPYRIHDGQDLCHRGFRALLRFMDLFKPRYLIHGHRHLYGHNQTAVTQYKETQVVNIFGYWVLEHNVYP